MPLTFAHPAAILPLSRKSRYIHFSALVLGSMAPDFEYFLRGQPMGEIGHTLTGFIWFNLPLVALIYVIYRTYVHHILFDHLPIYLQAPYTTRKDSNRLLKVVVFCYSALFGMLTHVVWDSFTHLNGYMVLKFPALLTYSTTIFGFQIPLYKFLQHGSTVVGLSVILVYMYSSASSQRKHDPISPKRKLDFWSSIFLLTGLFMCIWFLFDYVPITSYGIWVVRIIDCFLFSLLTISLFFNYIKKH